MPQPRKCTTSIEREIAYCLRLGNFPVDLGSPSMSSIARWRIALDRATRLLQTISEEMQNYSDEWTERWHEDQSAEYFHENIEQINDLRELLDDLRSNF
jgi:hypothetical protein